MPEHLWVAWIPTGKHGIDAGAFVAPGEHWCRRKAEEWLKANPEHVGTVLYAPIDMSQVVTAHIEVEEPTVVHSGDIEF